MISFSKQTKYISDKVNDKVKAASFNFHAKITSAWAVDTGRSKAAWQLPVQSNRGTGEWTIANNVNYSAVLWIGRHYVNGKAFGSDQMPLGGFPILAKVTEKLIKDLRVL